MLQNILIRNIAIADNVDVDWSPGMTSISGETGAGKSILLNSLGLALGDRADYGIVRHGQSRAEVVATFDVQRIPEAVHWLKERELDNQNECLLRRTISAEGRSRAFINGQPVPLAELKALGEMLIDIHSQHAHHSLLRPESHLQLLDDYAGHPDLLLSVKNAWVEWQGLERKLKHLQDNADEQNARKQLLEYQCEELDALGLQEGELEQLDSEYKRAHKSESLLAGSHRALELLDGEQDSNVLTVLRRSLNELQHLEDNTESLSSALTLLESSLIQAQEACNDLTSYINSFEFDQERIQVVEERLNKIHELARKHQVPSADLPGYIHILQTELETLTHEEDSLHELADAVKERKTKYLKFAQQLTKSRQKKAKLFEQEIIEKLDQLSMPASRFVIQFADESKATATGQDQVAFHLSVNPGQPMQPLAKVASGGELSRISLAIQVVCAEHSTIPTLVFDEVDVGISGATAEIVGHMLRSVGKRGQVICVTHLPQVAAQGHQHCIVHKTLTENQTTTSIRTLNQEQRIDELARMLGGIDITAQTRAHAEEMLRSQQNAH
ncbi:MAG: DNA repair protein RecN [Reinekea sp.]|jgi:DNA repair protein RecN (Recombination protein N)